MVVDDDRRRRQEVLLVEVRDLFVPAFLARARVERDEVVVGRDEEQIVAPHRGAAIADVRAAARPPEESPQQVPVVGVERPHVVGRSHVQHAVDREDRAFHRRGADELVVADTAYDDRRRRGAERRCDRRRPVARLSAAASRPALRFFTFA